MDTPNNSITIYSSALDTSNDMEDIELIVEYVFTDDESDFSFEGSWALDDEE